MVKSNTQFIIDRASEYGLEDIEVNRSKRSEIMKESYDVRTKHDGQWYTVEILTDVDVDIANNALLSCQVDDSLRVLKDALDENMTTTTIE